MAKLQTIFEKYGFAGLDQQCNLIKLLYLTGCFQPDILSEDLKKTGHSSFEIQHAIQVVQLAGSEKQTAGLELFDGILVLKNLFLNDIPNEKWPKKALDWLIRVTQREFFMRSFGQERWERLTAKWIQNYESEARFISNQLGLEASVSPKKKYYSAVLIFGSLAFEMEKCLVYAKKLVDEELIQTNHLYLLCGERLTHQSIDGEVIHEVALNKNLPAEQVTETHLMECLYQKVRGSEQFAQLPYTLLDTPKGSLSRPTTIDTLQYLVKLFPHLSGDVLGISRSPDIRAHYESMFSTLSQLLPNVNSEVVGEGTENSLLPEIISALGGALYGGYARVAREFNRSETWESLEKSRELLKNQCCL